MLALVLSLSLAATDPQTIIDRLPEGARADASAAMEMASRGDSGALPILRNLKETYPDEPRVFLLAALATTGAAKGSPLEDVTRAFELGVSGEDRRVALGLRARLHSNFGHAVQAEADAREILAQEPADPLALEVALRSALARHHRDDARDFATRLTAAQPGNPFPHVYLGALALEEQNPKVAQAELRRARALGAKGEVVDRIEAEADEEVRNDLLVEVPLYAAGALVLALALIVGVGLALTSLQRRRPATKGLLDTAHAGVLWLAVVMFYLGFPFVLAFAGLASYAIIRLAFEGMLAANYINLRMIALVVLLVLGAILSFVGVITGFLAKPAHRKLRVLVPGEAPELFNAVAEVTQVAASRPANRIEIGLAPDVSVHEAGSTFGVLFGRGERVLSLGLAALRGMSVSQVKSVLAHEFGHFAHGETRVAPVIAGVMLRLATICANYRSLGTFGVLNPVYWYLAGYLWIFRRLSAGLSRRHEFHADQVAARAYGGSHFASALRAVEENGLLFARYFLAVALELRRNGRRFTDGLAALDAISRGLPAEVRAHLDQLVAKEKPHTTDTHPSATERIKAVEGLTASRPEEPAPWTSLLPQHGALCRELTTEAMNELDEQLEKNHELPATSIELAPETEARLAVALATHCEALESFAEEHREESQRAASLERIAASIGAIAAAVGEKDRFLLEPLKRLARAQAALGRLPEAESTIDKALEVVGSLPEAQVTALELRSIRRSLRASRGLFTPEVEVSGLPPAQPGPAPSVAQPASATSTPAADRPKAPCSGCGSMVLLDDAQRLGCCPWCGASWTGPVTTPDQSSSTGSGAPN